MNFFTQNQLFFLFVFSLSVVAFVRYRNIEYIKQLFLSALNYNAAQSVQKTDINNKTLTNFLLSLNFYLSATIFLIAVLEKFRIIPLKISNVYIFSGVLIGIILIIYINIIINHVSAYIFNLKEIAGDFNKHNQYLYRSLGIILLVINIFVVYSSVKDFFLYSGIIIITLFYLLRIFRLIKINLSKQMNSFYLFLYLCTVEILPAVYIAKFFLIYYSITN
jgi:hypothetical protein